MHVIALVLAGLAVPCDSPAPAADVYEIKALKFALPFGIDPGQQERIAKIRFFVSRDDGKTWKRVWDYAPDDEEAVYSAPRDGLYFFSLQLVLKDGTMAPPDINGLSPSMKVCITTGKTAPKDDVPAWFKMPRAEMSQEATWSTIEDLRMVVEDLKRQVNEESKSCERTGPRPAKHD